MPRVQKSSGYDPDWLRGKLCRTAFDFTEELAAFETKGLSGARAKLGELRALVAKCEDTLQARKVELARQGRERSRPKPRWAQVKKLRGVPRI